MAVILLTGLIGALAVQQISSLTSKATDLNARDLPEAIILERLRALLYRQDDLEHSLLLDDDASLNHLSSITRQAAPDQGVTTELAVVIKEIDGTCQQLLAFERTEPGEDLTLVQRVADTTHKTSILSENIQTLVQHKRLAQARTLDSTQQEPLLLSAITTVTHLSSLEQAENAQDLMQVQQDSRQSILFVLTLTLSCLLLSIVLATIMTRSLTRPLNALLHTTEAIAAGDLHVEPQVKRSDEIGRLAAAYDRMRLSLRSTIASLSQERQHVQAIIDACADGIMLVDATYTIVKCNPAVEYLSGWHVHEAIGRYCWEVLGFQERSIAAAQANEQLFALMEALQTRSEPSFFEMSITARSGRTRWLAMSCSPLPLEGPDAMQATVIGLHDISQLKAVDQMKSDFVAMVSHELRAPLTTVTGSVETLHLLEPATDQESYQEVLGILDQQTRRLRQVVEEVLQLTRFEAGHLQVQVQPLPLTRFLHDLAESINAEWAGSDYYLVLHQTAQESVVWADRPN